MCPVPACFGALRLNTGEARTQAPQRSHHSLPEGKIAVKKRPSKMMRMFLALDWHFGALAFYSIYPSTHELT
jgi:hypothetical protein